jgi:hypothetical protein
MLYYMSDTLGLRVDQRLRTRLFFSTLARRLATDPSLWQKPARVRPPSADIGAWVSEALANTPARVCRLPQPDTVIIGDACRLGYAGVVVHRLPSGELTTAMFQHQWRRRFGGTLDYGLSTVSEPEAAARLLDETAKLFPGMVPHYITDHDPFVGAFERGFSIAPGYNSRVARIRDRHPDATLSYQPGESMIADKYSRFHAQVLSAADAEAAKSVASQILCGVMGQTDCARVVGRGRLVTRKP